MSDGPPIPLSLTDRWKAHTISQKTDLRAKLLDAVARHEGWEESAIALVDEAIMPVLASHQATPDREGLRAALKRLVDLKAHKDAHGKNNWYVRNQKDAWDQATAVLAALGDASIRKDEERFRDSLPQASSTNNTSEISVVGDDLVEALMNEHDMDVPDNLLATPDHPHFKAHRNGVKAMLHFLDKRGYKKPLEPVSGEVRMEAKKTPHRLYYDYRWWQAEQAPASIEKCVTQPYPEWKQYEAGEISKEALVKAILDAAGVKYVD